MKTHRVVCCTEKRKISFKQKTTLLVRLTFILMKKREEVDVKDFSLCRIFFKTILKNDLVDRIHLIYRKEKNITV